MSRLHYCSWCHTSSSWREGGRGGSGHRNGDPPSPPCELRALTALMHRTKVEETIRSAMRSHQPRRPSTCWHVDLRLLSVTTDLWHEYSALMCWSEWCNMLDSATLTHANVLWCMYKKKKNILYDIEMLFSHIWQDHFQRIDMFEIKIDSK